MSPRDWSALAAALGGRFRLAEPLSRHTSFKIGGPAEAWAQPEDEPELKDCLDPRQGPGRAGDPAGRLGPTCWCATAASPAWC